MKFCLHITSGDSAGELLEKSSLVGEVLVWHDICYQGVRKEGWPDSKALTQRAIFLEKVTGGGLSRQHVLEVLQQQYSKLESAAEFANIILWFDACLFDQTMLAHILSCIDYLKLEDVDLICVSEFPGIVPFHGLGQLSPEQLASLYGQRHKVNAAQYRFAHEVEKAFAAQDTGAITRLAKQGDAPISAIPAAASRWLDELPDPHTGLGRLERLVLRAIDNGCVSPDEIYKEVAAAETPPQYWGDITLWAVINGLAERDPPLLTIQGPQQRLPQWDAADLLPHYRISMK